MDTGLVRQGFSGRLGGAAVADAGAEASAGAVADAEADAEADAGAGAGVSAGARAEASAGGAVASASAEAGADASAVAGAGAGPFGYGDGGPLNLGYSAGQAPSLVLENRRRLAAAAGFSLASWRGLRQAHGKRIVLVAGAGMGNAEPGAPLPEADGQITRDAGVTLITQHADCVPLYFLDPGRQAVGLAHAGWKGTLLDIAGAMVRAMGEAFGSRPGDLLVAIGPGAGPCHYEVDEPVLAPARERFAAMPGALESVTRPSGRPGRAWLDLWRANALLLTASGVLWERISVAGLCTICCNDRLFSHRQGDRGRQVAFIGLS